MFFCLILLPFFCAFFSGFFGRYLGVKGVRIYVVFNMFLIFLFSCIFFYKLLSEDIVIKLVLFNWISLDDIYVNWGFCLDGLSSMMLIPITFISFLVHLYSLGYMINDNHFQRFFSYLSLFTFFMILLVLGDNFLVMFVGWEGVGVCSYLLINFWFTRVLANKGAISAIITNRVGDMFFSFGMFMLLFFVGSLDFGVVLGCFDFFSSNLVFFLGVLFLLGAMAKSAQIGLHFWLPLAMEAPTPVSALLHAATMVTAGVYLLVRISPIIEYSSILLLVIMLVGGFTSFLASLVGLYQNDIKRIIAYSTCSQLGMMFMAIGLSQYGLAIYHLFNHSFYKALLFLSAGSVIHGMGDEQDIRKYGNLLFYLSYTFVMMFVGSVSLMAFPYLTGYYSKDFIIESLNGSGSLLGCFLFYLSLVGSLLTSFYSVKLLYRVFFSFRDGLINNRIFKGVHEPVLSMGLPLFILSIFSIYLGYMFKDIFLGIGSPFFDSSIFVLFNNYNLLEVEFDIYNSIYIKLYPFFFIILGFIFYFLLLVIDYNLGVFNKKKFFFIYLKMLVVNSLNNKFYYDFFINRYILFNYLYFGYFFFKYIDLGVLDNKFNLGFINLVYYIVNVVYLEGDNIGFFLVYVFVFFLLIFNLHIFGIYFFFGLILYFFFVFKV